MTFRPANQVSRRTALKALGVGTGVVGLSAFITPAAYAVDAPLTTAFGAGGDGPLTVASWRAGTATPVYIAHRGSGDVYPEHSMEAYQAAVDFGATCMEISVGMTSDDVLICMHDSTYDRTTNGTGAIRGQHSSVLDTTRIWQPGLGAAWTRNPPQIPLFEEVLQKFGSSVILCVEAKLSAAYEPMMALVEKYGLQDSVIVKAHYSSANLERAQAAGYPVFSYFGSVNEVVPGAVQDAAARLRPESDVLVLAGVNTAQTSYPYVSDAAVRAAVASGVPVWMHPLHRRSDAEHFFALGVQGAICSSYGYISGATKPVASDSWSRQAIAPGEISKSPASSAYAPTFTPDGQLILDAQNIQHFMTLGQFCPIPAAAASYAIDVDVSWAALPGSDMDKITIAFGRDDDRYYQHRLGEGTGYHLILRRNGELALYLHQDGATGGIRLAPSEATPAFEVGDWAHLRITVTPDTITASRTDAAATISVADTTARGGYVHVGRASNSGSAAFKGFTVS